MDLKFFEIGTTKFISAAFLRKERNIIGGIGK